MSNDHLIAVIEAELMKWPDFARGWTANEVRGLAADISETVTANGYGNGSTWLSMPERDPPRDGTKFLAFTADFELGRRFNERVQEARWSGSHFASANGQLITHWMPFPAAPSARKE